MKNRLFFVIVVMLHFRGITFSQLNESDTSKFQLRMGTTGAWQEGNVTIFTIRSKIDLVSNGKKSIVFKSQSNNLYQEFGHKKADQDLYSRNFLYYRPSSTLYPFFMMFAQSNFRREITYRYFVGLGTTFQAVKKPKTNLKISLAIVNEDTKFKNDIFNQSYYNGSTHISVWRSTAYLSGIHYFLGKKMKIFYNAYWQTALDLVANNRMQLDVGTEIAVWQGLYIQLEYIHNYEQVVAQKVKEIDSILTFGINYQIKK